MADEVKEYIGYTGDDTQAFGKNCIEIDIINPDNVQVSKAEFKTGCISKTFVNPTFPLEINFTSAETQKLNYVNIGYFKVWDEHGRGQQCEGFKKFYCKNGAFYE